MLVAPQPKKGFLCLGMCDVIYNNITHMMTDSLAQMIYLIDDHSTSK